MLRSIVLTSLFIGSLSGGLIAHAQTAYTSPNGTTYTIPAGYQFYSDGIFYNPSVNTYYYAVNGTYSSAAPSSAIVTPTGIIPMGYTIWGGGMYYNPSTGLYYNPMTGQYSSTFPGISVTPGTPVVTANTPIYSIPAGYISTGTGGIYFNSATNQYFDPSTGRYWYPTSATQMSTTYYPASYSTYANTSYTGASYGTYSAYSPNFPNTGVGGDSTRVRDIALLGMTLTLAGIAFAVRAWRHQQLA